MLSCNLHKARVARTVFVMIPDAAPEPLELPEQLRHEFVRRLTNRADSEAAATLRQVARDLPDLVVDAELRRLTTEVIKGSFQSLSTTLLLETSGQAPLLAATEEIVQHLADRGAAADVVESVFLNASRVFVRDVVSTAVEVLPAGMTPQVLPPLVDVVLAQLAARHRKTVGAFFERRQRRHRRSDAALQARLRSVLDGEVTDGAVASRLLGYPVSSWNIAAVVRTKFDFDEAISGLERRLRETLPTERTLVVNLAEDTAALWASCQSQPTQQHWAEQIRKDESLVGAFGQPEWGITGFVRTYEQATAAFRVVSASGNGPRAADYSEVAPLTFMLHSPEHTRRWLGATLGPLAGGAADAERLRFTLRHYLAAGENGSVTAERLYIHRNTVNYRIAQAVGMLPDGLEGHRTDIALALDLLAWIPDAADPVTP
ncbi:PucR family transcriptional regulator [Actinomyces qiguomingii]|uniref:PucR family transcriptional regulator n=1 Tax=Actinomyces qiguomingii TaxID=2057800 RepID=UPI000CA02558|nr:helix-turn-helix domain-containing protein [Actinomyces qiguomingii]